MKKRTIMPIILMVWPYLFFAGILFPEGTETALQTFFYGYTVLTAVVYLANMIYICRSRGEHVAKNLSFWNMIIKLVHIPFYLGVFAFGALFMLMMVVPAFVMISPMVAMMLAVIDYLLMLTSSCYGIKAIHKARKQEIFSWKSALWHTILHLFFVTDVISAVCVYRKIKKNQMKKEQNV